MITAKHKTKAYAFFGSKTDQKNYFVKTPQLMQEIADIAYEAKKLQDRTAVDQGTCVLGAGITVELFETSRNKYPKSVNIIRAPFQGNTGSYKALKPCLDYIQANYPELHARWEDGNMD